MAFWARNVFQTFEKWAPGLPPAGWGLKSVCFVAALKRPRVEYTYIHIVSLHHFIKIKK